MSKKHLLEKMADHREDSYESEEDPYDESEEEDTGGKSVKHKPKAEGTNKTSIRAWTENEDSLVTTLIGRLGKKWTAVGNEINRTGKQVRERFLNTLDPTLSRDAAKKRTPWVFEEDVRLYEGNIRLGNKWVQIKKALFPYRAESDVKNRATHQQYLASVKEYKAGRKPSNPSPGLPSLPSLSSPVHAHANAHAYAPDGHPHLHIQTLAVWADSRSREAASSPLETLASESEKLFKKLLAEMGGGGGEGDMDVETTSATPLWSESFKSLNFGPDSSYDPGDSSKSVGLALMDLL